MTYAVAKPRYLTRAHVYGEGKTTVEHVVEPYYGYHPTVAAAKRAYVVALVPDLADASDAYITRYFLKEPRRLHDMRIIKVTP